MKLLFLIVGVFLSQGVLGSPAEGAFKKFKESGGLQWAVLVAGSNTYGNYRHQADICHAYQIMKRHGIPDERIIVMMYDDIAHNSLNPQKGVIINRPNGPNVYPGVLKDYTGEDVNPKNFLAVLKGDAKGVTTSGVAKVLKSGENDNVFVYFADHGGTDNVAFPSEYLYKRDLHHALQYMHQKKMYKKMVIYIEACESGSMFTGSSELAPDMNIFATTAANATQSSYAYYWSDKFNAYLGDLYSISWMEDTDKENIQKETLDKQFEIVKKRTIKSNVQELGNMEISKLPVGAFQGKKRAAPLTVPDISGQYMEAVNSREVAVYTEMHKLEAAQTLTDKLAILQGLQEIFERRVELVRKMLSITSSLNVRSNMDRKRPDLKESEACYYTVLEAFNRRCYNLAKSPYSLGEMKHLKDLCEEGVQTMNIWGAIDATCRGEPITGTI